jgi:thiol-disulfide isomerase/thioredoxin
MNNFLEVSNDNELLEAVKGSPLVALNFWADWAEPCGQMNEVFKELAKKHPSVTFIQVRPLQGKADGKGPSRRRGRSSRTIFN